MREESAWAESITREANLKHPTWDETIKKLGGPEGSNSFFIVKEKNES